MTRMACRTKAMPACPLARLYCCANWRAPETLLAMTTAFPERMDFSGFNAPSRIECDIYDLVIEGTLPAEIDGTWYRSVPDHQYPPKLGHDTFLSGDGMVSAMRFENGHADFKQ